MSTYNGWTNYETWATALWLSNEYGTYLETTEKAKEQPGQYEFEDWLKNYVEEMMPDLGGSLAADLLGAALSEVNWREIAENLLEDNKPEESDS